MKLQTTGMAPSEVESLKVGGKRRRGPQAERADHRFAVLERRGDILLRTTKERSDWGGIGRVTHHKRRNGA